MRLLLDEMLDREVAIQLRRRGHDVVAIQEDPSLWGTPDYALFTEIAFQAGRVLVTDNVKDFLPLHAELLAIGSHHAGLLLAASGRFPRAKITIGRWVTALDTYLRTLPSGATLGDTYSWL